MMGENLSTQIKIRPSAILSTTRPTCCGPRLNLGQCGERPATSSLSHHTSLECAECQSNIAASTIFKGQIKGQYKRSHEIVVQM
jgi:hypothetical protein